MFKIVNGYEDVDRNMSFKLKEGSRTRGYKAALVKSSVGWTWVLFLTKNEWNKLPNDCVNASSVNMFKNRIDRYLIRAGYTWENCCTLDKLMASLSTCHLELVVWDGNLVKYCLLRIIKVLILILVVSHSKPISSLKPPHLLHAVFWQSAIFLSRRLCHPR